MSLIRTFEYLTHYFKLSLKLVRIGKLENQVVVDERQVTLESIRCIGKSTYKT
jgi:hypothetical protein